MSAELDGVVSASSVQYLDRAVRHAERRGCMLLLRVDSPGGTLEATRQIVERFLSAPVPIVAHVAPKGARAGSAAMFVTLSAHVAAMAKASNIGAAHPVTASGGDPEEEGGEQVARKIINDTAALARAVASARGRNVEWAERAVRESSSLTAAEALSKGVIDLVTQSTTELLDRLDGRTVRVEGRSVILRTGGIDPEVLDKTLREHTLALLGHPTVAYALLSLGMLGITIEFLSPGTFIAGGVGIVSLLLGTIGMNLLPTSIGALLLLFLALGLFIAEIYVTSYGALALGGVTLMVLGSLLLIDVSDPSFFVDRDFGVGWGAVLPTSMLLAGAALAVGWLAQRSREQQAVVGADDMLGSAGEALTAISNETGQVRLRGERWSATSEEPIEAGVPVTIVGIDGLKLRVVAAARSSGLGVNEPENRK